MLKKKENKKETLFLRISFMQNPDLKISILEKFLILIFSLKNSYIISFFLFFQKKILKRKRNKKETLFLQTFFTQNPDLRIFEKFLILISSFKNGYIISFYLFFQKKKLDTQEEKKNKKKTLFLRTSFTQNADLRILILQKCLILISSFKNDYITSFYFFFQKKILKRKKNKKETLFLRTSFT